MRLIVFGFLLITGFCNAQADSSIVFSRIENAVMKPGKVFMTESLRYEEVNNLSIGLLQSLNLDSSDKYKAVAFTNSPVFGKPVFTVHSVHVDMEEIDDLISAVSKFKDVIQNKRATNYEVYQYTTSNLVVFRFENKLNNFERWDLSVYKRYKTLNVPVNGTELYLNGKFINEFLKALAAIKDFHIKFPD